MKRFCYRCRECGKTTESDAYAPGLCPCGGFLVRDYKAEAVNVAKVKI